MNTKCCKNYIKNMSNKAVMSKCIKPMYNREQQSIEVQNFNESILNLKLSKNSAARKNNIRSIFETIQYCNSPTVLFNFSSDDRINYLGFISEIVEVSKTFGCFNFIFVKSKEENVSYCHDISGQVKSKGACLVVGGYDLENDKIFNGCYVKIDITTK